MLRGLRSFAAGRHLFLFFVVLFLVVSCDSVQSPVASEEPELETQATTLSLSSAVSTLNTNITVKAFNSAASKGGYSIKWHAPLNINEACKLANKTNGCLSLSTIVFGTTDYLMIGEVVGRKNTWVRSIVRVGKDGKRSVYGQQVLFDNTKEKGLFSTSTIVTDLNTGAVIKNTTWNLTLDNGTKPTFKSMGGLSGVSTFDRMLTPTNWGNYVYNVTAKPAESPSNFANACSPTDLTGLQVQCGGGAGGTPNHPSTPDPDPPPSCDPRSCREQRNARNVAAVGTGAAAVGYVTTLIGISGACTNPVGVITLTCAGAIAGNQAANVGVTTGIIGTSAANKRLNDCLEAQKNDC